MAGQKYLPLLLLAFVLCSQGVKAQDNEDNDAEKHDDPRLDALPVVVDVLESSNGTSNDQSNGQRSFYQVIHSIISELNQLSRDQPQPQAVNEWKKAEPQVQAVNELVNEEPQVEAVIDMRAPTTVPPPQLDATEAARVLNTAANDTDAANETGAALLEEFIVKPTGTGTLWINRTGDALQYGLNTTLMNDCDLWREYWDYQGNATVEEDSSNNGTNQTENSMEKPVKWRNFNFEYKAAAEAFGLDPELLNTYREIHVNVEEVCGDWPSIYWANETEIVGNVFGLVDDKYEELCSPYLDSLEPRLEEWLAWSDNLQEAANVRLQNATFLQELIEVSKSGNGTIEDLQSESDVLAETAAEERELRLVIRAKRSAVPENLRRIRETENADMETADDENINLSTNGTEMANETVSVDFWLDTTDPVRPIFYISNDVAFLALGVPKTPIFDRYLTVGIAMKSACDNIVTKSEEAFDITEFANVSGIEDLKIGIDTDLFKYHLNLTELSQTLRNDVAIDNLLERLSTNKSATHAGSYIVPVLEKFRYDVNSAPVFFKGQVVIIRVGVYIESISNFELTSMDYEMNLYIRMAWRDPRLAHNYSLPILIKEEDLLGAIWKPDPYFANAKEADYHDVTFLNFLMLIQHGGEVYYETRVSVKPSCNLVLCKFPHDEQRCVAYPIEQLRFEWFSNTTFALSKNANVKLPELYIAAMKPVICDGDRVGVNYTCLFTDFTLKRDVGYHIAQTYIPTILSLMFSWVGVWLPEDFLEGRIGLAITVLLTLSTESAGAREHLPSVSYTKAIDIWFGFVTGFVFITLLQTLIVIGFGKRANNLQKRAKKDNTLSEFTKEKLTLKATAYHDWSRLLDKMCRIVYPVSLCVFLIYYFFVATQGPQDDCISARGF